MSEAATGRVFERLAGPDGLTEHEIQQYRRDYHITDPVRALGPEPGDPAQRADRQRVHAAIEGLHTKQRTTDRSHQRQPTGERTSQPRAHQQRGRQGPERAAG